MAKSISLVGLVAKWADLIQNGRTLRTIHDAMREENDEVGEEITLLEQGDPAGPDGVFGECCDLIASTLDMIREVRPNSSIEELEREVFDYVNTKCRKWAMKYGQEGIEIPPPSHFEMP